MTSRKHITLGSTSVLVASLAVQSCGEDGDHSRAPRESGAVVDRADQPLTLDSVRSINGTYGAGCAGASAGSAWSVATIAGLPQGELTNPPLTLYQPETLGPSGCQITLTQIVARPTSGSANVVSNVTYTADSGIALGNTWTTENVRRFASGSSGVDFYGNAVLTAAGNAVTIEFRFSEDPVVANAPVTVPVAGTYSYSAGGAAVSAPVYTLSFAQDSGFFERNGVVLMVGDTTLVPPTSTTGRTFVGYGVTPTAFDANSTFAAVHAEYERVTAAPGAPAPANDPLTGAEVTTWLASTTPPRKLSVIIATTDTATAIRTYQVITLAFENAPRPCVPDEALATGCVCLPPLGPYQGSCRYL